jgi:hypothetical protein
LGGRRRWCFWKEASSSTLLLQCRAQHSRAVCPVDAFLSFL